MEIPLWEVGVMMVYKPEHFISKIIETLKSRNIKEIPGDLVIDDTYFDFQKFLEDGLIMTLGIITELEFGA